MTNDSLAPIIIHVHCNLVKLGNFQKLGDEYSYSSPSVLNADLLLCCAACDACGVLGAIALDNSRNKIFVEVFKDTLKT
ncbi:MAG: hypothetical protein V7K14_06900 [Nostoc sp.]|uniref:hypothetical protein n=1 Tax=unclassified Nostoc TaxID=2593658 RepID=UPI0025E389B0|nr:hypothetical protein [Nostoc sp. NMS7]MBN3946643.1 hypothetical protein [Nostoc sp. NMS7]